MAETDRRRQPTLSTTIPFGTEALCAAFERSPAAARLSQAIAARWSLLSTERVAVNV
jgi:hypothetical protein